MEYRSIGIMQLKNMEKNDEQMLTVSEKSKAIKHISMCITATKENTFYSTKVERSRKII